MTDQTEDFDSIGSRYANLKFADRALAELSLRPRWPVYFFTAAAVFTAWIWLAFMVSNSSLSLKAGQLGPGMSFLQSWLGEFSDGSYIGGVIAFVAEICAPQAVAGVDFSTAATVFLMWMVMSFAMMLPSAAPLLRTYSDIADVAAQKDEPVVSVTFLALGYVIAWAGFSTLATVLQLGLIWIGLLADPIYPVAGILGGTILILAGLYQFSALKHACLEKCRNPFSFLFGRWTTKISGVIRLGIEQGAFCVGCCWALMMVMLVVGTMNLAWMAFFTLFAILEKSGKGKVTSHFSGVILVSWGGLLLFLSAV